MSIADGELKKVISQYKLDLPSPELITSELVRWAHHTKDEVSHTITEALDKCDKDMFPNIHVLLRIAATLPVTTCENERSFSTLRRLNSYLRRTQTSERLDSLALINIHCGNDIEVDRVIDMFSKLHPRKLELSSVLFEK